ncbi:MAG: PLP-dependent aminotransferase family protein [Bacillota bacterium]
MQDAWLGPFLSEGMKHIGPPPESLPPGADGRLIPLSWGYPSPDSFPLEEMARALRLTLEEEGAASLQYSGGPSCGRLREVLAHLVLARRIHCGPEDILVTTGSNQAIDLVARAFVDPGDVVLVEDPTFFTALRIFQSRAARVRGITVEEDGLSVAELEQVLHDLNRKGERVKVLYLIPSFQNPTGRTLGPRKRARIVELAQRYDFLILEDDAYGLLYYDSPPPPALKSIDDEGRVIYVSTLSKLIAPGIRLGWAVAPPPVLSALRQVKLDAGTSPFMQAFAYRLWEQIGEARADWLRSLYRPRRDAMLAALEKESPEGFRWTRPGGGFFIWVEGPAGFDAASFRPLASGSGVDFIPGANFSGDGKARAGMRLCFSYCSIPEIEEGVSRLARALRQHAGT